ncbi:heavy-metal-associated domain-containing protein [Streptomyces sp. NBRC 109706]|uniref:heavy-metal-associated domain-containing protein n=1 Tax=Streptomyces sp. NBRC 109706 TaxID=1550035 RepID=UPI00078337A8|nr:heavy-metal-associated domain-containing protein [Streptomyces sp. NBRC 109706]
MSTSTGATTVTGYTVKGMTCGHCVSAVSAEIGRIGGVSEVGVDLAEGLVTVVSEAPLAEESVAAAVEEAGYELVRPTPAALPTVDAEQGGGCCGGGGCH